ncbi:MAG: hypothetical protein GX858_01645, partial [Clostridiales bacterium]|nr:hypothetical protein [Clostridiales bacterium]
MRETNQKISQKGMWALLLALTLTAFTLLNVFSLLAGQRFALVLDMTEEKLYELSGQTEQVLSEMPEDTTLKIFSREEAYPQMLRDTIRRYAILTAKLHVLYVDPLENPVLMSHYQQMGHS